MGDTQLYDPNLAPEDDVLIGAGAGAKHLSAITSQLAELATKVYMNHYPRQAGENDDTARFLRAVTDAPEYSTIVFATNVNYTITSITINKSLNIDLNGCNLTVHPADSSGNGVPAISFQGTLGTAYNLTTCTQGSTTVTLANTGDGTNFSAGDYVIIQDSKQVLSWNGGSGYGGRLEITFIDSISSDTLTLGKPLEWGYDTTPTITKITKPLKQPKILNGGLITEIDPGVQYPGTLPPDSPHIFQFRYCIEPYVEKCNFEKWQLHCVNFYLCINPQINGGSAIDPFRPLLGGHGYFMRFDRCTGGNTNGVVTRKVRHTVDFNQSYDCASTNNLAINGQVVDFYCHGLGSKRCVSSLDTSIGNTGFGWASGNDTFSGDYDYTVINPKYYGLGTSIVCQTKSVGMKIIAPHIETNYVGILGSKGASGVQVVGGKITILSTTNSNSKAIQTTKDASGLAFGDFSILNTEITVNTTSGSVNGIVISSSGSIDLKDLKLNMVGGGGTALYVDSNSTPTDLEIRGIRLTGSSYAGLSINAVPTRSYNVSNNFVSAFTGGSGSYGIATPAASNLRLENNHVAGTQRQFNVTGDLATAIKSGAVVRNNLPDSYDSNSTVQGSAAPNYAPPSVGRIFLDTTNKKMYIAMGTSSSNDWILMN